MEIIKKEEYEENIVACVLKSGGDYDETYVEKLFNGVSRNLTIDYNFVCLTDINLTCCDTLPLKKNELKGWWSKLELFKNFRKGKILYLDLDTLIINNIDSLFKNMNKELSLLGPFEKIKRKKRHRFQSGVMTWTNDNIKIFNKGLKNQVWKKYKGDQDYLANEFDLKLVNGLKAISYKYDYKILLNKIDQKELIDNSKLICFHGKPKPINEINSLTKKYWI